LEFWLFGRNEGISQNEHGWEFRNCRSIRISTKKQLILTIKKAIKEKRRRSREFSREGAGVGKTIRRAEKEN